MLKYNEKEFRNLEDQVGYLTDAFHSGKLIDELGIKVLGVFPDLATAKNTIRPPYEYGDAFEIGETKPYSLYIYTRNIEDFFDFGPFPAPGPKGELGPTPSISIKANVTNTTGIPEATVTKTGTDEAPIFNFTFKNIKGERGQTGMQGIQGPIGLTGRTGPIGPQGNKGDKGDTGPAFKLLGNLTSTSQLPTPTTALQAQGASYTIPNAQGVKHIWVIQGTDSLLWVDIGESGVQGPKGDPGDGINSLKTVKDIGAPSVTYNTTDGITINNTERYTYITAGSGAQVDVSTEKKIPLIAGEGISIDATNEADKAVIKTLSSNISNGTGIGSLVQKRLKSDGVTWTTAKAYQKTTVALGGNTQAGMTFEEWKVINPDGTQEEYDYIHSFAFAHGQSTKALGGASHSEGNITVANGVMSHAEGSETQSNGKGSHSEGYNTISDGNFSHSEGDNTRAIGFASHSEGSGTKATALFAHSEGDSTEASAHASHSEGYHTKATHIGQTVCGRYNVGVADTLFEVGNGTSGTDRRNAFEVLKDGRAKVQSAPVDDDDVVRKVDLSGLSGGKIYKHSVTMTNDSYANVYQFSYYSSNPNLPGTADDLTSEGVLLIDTVIFNLVSMTANYVTSYNNTSKTLYLRNITTSADSTLDLSSATIMNGNTTEL